MQPEGQKNSHRHCRQLQLPQTRPSEGIIRTLWLFDIISTRSRPPLELNELHAAGRFNWIHLCPASCWANPIKISTARFGSDKERIERRTANHPPNTVQVLPGFTWAPTRFLELQSATCTRSKVTQCSVSTRSGRTHAAPWHMQHISVACGRQLHSIASILGAEHHHCLERRSKRTPRKKKAETERAAGEEKGARRAEHFAGAFPLIRHTHFPLVFPRIRSVIVGLCLLVRVFAFLVAAASGFS